MTVNVNVRFPNLAQAPRKEVAYTALPFAEGEWDGFEPLVLKDLQGNIIESHIEAMGVRWPDGSVRYGKMLSMVSLAANETKLATVVNGVDPSQPQFQPHQSLLASAGRIEFKVMVKTNGQWTANNFTTNLVTIEDNRMRKVFRFRQRMDDLVLDLKLYLCSNQQLIKFELSITGSNPSNTLINYPVEEIRLVMEGNILVNIRGAQRRGVSTIIPYKEYRLMSNDYFGDAQKQSWYGEIIPQLNVSDIEQVSNTIAAIQYVLYGMSTDWGTKGAFASLGAIQQPDSPNVQTQWTKIIAQFQQFFGFVNTPGNVWDDYLLGLTKTPGQTGDQADFGCLEAGAALYMGAAELLDMIYFMATEETKRPGHYHEADGTPIQAASHPNWIVWDGRTHWHMGVSPDRLGKTGPNLGGDTHGWNGKDWEHHSSNLLSLASLMTGSHLLLDEVNVEIELYLSGHTLPSLKPGWSTNWRFPPRAFGRTHHAMSNHYLLTARQDLVTRMIARFNECVLPQWDGATHYPVQNWEHIRDDRVLGVTVDAWVPWNDSLGFVGAVALYNVTRSPAIKSMLTSWGKTILNHGWHADYDGSVLVNLSLGGGNKWFADGRGLTETEYHDLTHYIPAGGGLVLWGVQVLEVIKNNSSVFGEESANKAALYAQYMRQQYAPQPNNPFPEYGQWTAIRLM